MQAGRLMAHDSVSGSMQTVALAGRYPAKAELEEQNQIIVTVPSVESPGGRRLAARISAHPRERRSRPVSAGGSSTAARGPTVRLLAGSHGVKPPSPAGSGLPLGAR